MSQGDTELTRARNVQSAMLPDAPSVPGLEIAASYRACDHVGGDFYDFVVVDQWRLGFVMADVSGHGTAAALVMAAAKKTLQMCGRGCLSPREALLAANDHLQREIPRGMFVSVFYGVLDVRDCGFTFVRAGHNPLLVVRGAEVHAYSPNGAVLGIMTSTDLADVLKEETVELGEGDRALLYTDGLTEAVNAERGMWGDARLREALATETSPAAAVVDSLLLKVDEFRAGEKQNDDEALVVIRPVERDGDPQPLKVEGGATETNLPPHSTSLIGRDEEVSQLLGQLTDSAGGVVTVSGTAGIGKTRVALGAASLALSAFPAGVWLAELGDVEDAEGVCKEVGRALGVDLSSGDAAERVGLALQGRTRTRDGRLLLIFDNADKCRSDVGDLVEQWRALSTGIVVLVTSRGSIGLKGETAFPLRPLLVPRHKKTGRIEQVDEAGLRTLSTLPSVALFVARAKERDARFELTRDNSDAVGQLCVRLDGIPLAIELAAARAKVLSPQKMLERLKQRFALLRDQRATNRQSTLRGAIEWSWELLDDAERETLAQLSVCRGGFFLELAEQVVDLDHLPDAPMVMDVIEGLHDKSLIDSVELPKLDGERRFSMFESIRLYAGEQLRERGGQDAAEARWREALTGYAREWHELKTMEARTRLQLELDALGEVARGTDEHATWAALIAGPILQRLGSPRAARELLGSVVANCEDADLRNRLHIAHAMALVHEDPAGAEEILSQVPEDSAQYIEAILAQGQTYQNRGQGNVMKEILHKLEKRDDLTPLQRGRISAGLGNATIMTGDVNAGLEYYLKTLKLAEELNDSVMEGQVTGNIGVVYNMKGDLEKALEYFNRALELMEGQDHQLAEAYWLVNIGGLHQVREEWDEAEARLTRALKLGQENGLREVSAAALGALATVMSKRGRFDEALEMVGEALDIDDATGNLRGRSAHLTQKMVILNDMGRMEEYEAGLHEIIELGKQIGDRVIVAERIGDLGVFQYERAKESGDKDLLEQAVTNMREGADTLDELGAGRATEGRIALAEGLIELDRIEEARDAIEQLLSHEPRGDKEREHHDKARKLLEQLDGDRTSD